MRARKQRHGIDDTPVDYDYYEAKILAERPTLVRWLAGKGPRPIDPSLGFTAQDRRTLRRLHVKGIARDDPRYFDALIEAAIAGDRLSKKETKELAEHARVMEDGFYPALQNRACELNTESQVLGRTISVMQPKSKVGAKVIGGGRARGLANAKAQAALRKQWKCDLDNYYTQYPLTRRVSYRAEADRILTRDVRVTWTTDTPGYELLRKDLLPPLLRAKFPRLYS